MKTIAQNTKRVVVLLSVVALFVSCGQRSERDEVLAQVNKRNVTIRDFEMALSKVNEIPIKNYDKQENKTDLLRDLIDEELLYQAAVKSKIYERSYAVKQALVREYLKERYNTKLSSVSKKEVEAFFKQNEAFFSQVKASHILIQAGEASGRSDKEALAKIETILKEYNKNPGVDHFKALAKQYSEDPGSKKSGGDLGYFNKKTMVKEFAQTSFALNNIGDVSKPVKTQFGYHIIVLTGDKRGLEHYEKDIKQHLTQRKNKKNLENELANLRSAANIKVLQNNLAKLEK